MKKIFISSPYRAEPLKNKRLIYKLCYQTMRHGYAPFAPHGFYTNFLKETPEHREMGFDAAFAFLLVCDELWVYNLAKISEGMQSEIDYARENWKPIKYLFDSNGFLHPEFTWFKKIGERIWRG